MANGTVLGGKGIEKHVPIMINRRTVDKWILGIVGAIVGGASVKYAWDQLYGTNQKPMDSLDISKIPEYLTDPANCVYQLGNRLYDLDPGHQYTAKLGGVYSKAPYNGVEHVADAGVSAVDIAVGYDGKNPLLFLFATKAYMDRYSNPDVAPKERPGNIRYRNDIDVLQIDTGAAKEIPQFPGMFVQTKQVNLADLKNVIAVSSPDDYYQKILNVGGIKKSLGTA